MNCKNCGTENPDESVYCKSCGKRLDGATFCTSCGKQLASDSVFCNYCGKRIVPLQVQIPSAPPVPAQAPAQTQAPYAPVSPAVLQQGKPSTTTVAQKVLRYIATSAVLATAVFSLIFVFLMGTTSTASMWIYGGETNSVTTYLYYFFGDGYTELAKALEGTAFTDFYATCSYTPVVLGTLVSAVTLIVVLITSIFAIVTSIKNLLGKNKYSGAAYALTAFMAFVTGSLLLLAIHNSSINYESVKTTCSLNGGTIAGIVLCAFFASTYVGCSIALRGKALLKTGAIAKTVLSGVSIILVVIVMALASLPAYGISSEDMIYGQYVNVGSQYLITALGLLCRNKVTDNFAAVYTLAFLAYVSLAVLAILAAALIVKSVKSLSYRSYNKTGLAVSISITVFALLYLVFSIVAGQQFFVAADLAGGTSISGTSTNGATFTYAVPIVTFVFSLFALGVNIAYFCVAKSTKNKPVTVQPIPVQQPVFAPQSEPAPQTEVASQPEVAPQTEQNS